MQILRYVDQFVFCFVRNPEVYNCFAGIVSATAVGRQQKQTTGPVSLNNCHYLIRR